MNLNDYVGKGDSLLHLAICEKYLTADEETYTHPDLPVSIPDFSEYRDNGNVKFGQPMRKHFHLGQEFNFMNHGAFGCPLKEALNTSHELQIYVDTQPLKVLDREMVPWMAHTIRQMAHFVGCDAQDLVFLENCSTGISTILKSLTFQPGDKILSTNFGYGAVQKAIHYVCERTGAVEYIARLTLPVSGSEQILTAIESQLTDGIKLAVFDHIPSTESFIMPIKELIDMCRKRGIMVLVDAAHSLGQLHVDLRSLDPDFYVANCHKWFSNTRGSALMYVKRQLQSQIRPLVVSWGQKQGYSAEFMWSGTQYFSQYISLLTTLNFWKSIGADAIRSYCHGLLVQAETLLIAAWNVPKTCPGDMMGMMALIKVPDAFNDPNWKPNLTMKQKRQILQDHLYFDCKIEVPVRLCGGLLYVRISCHVYNELRNYEELAVTMLQLIDRKDVMEDRATQFYP